MAYGLLGRRLSGDICNYAGKWLAREYVSFWAQLRHFWDHVRRASVGCVECDISFRAGGMKPFNWPLSQLKFYGRPILHRQAKGRRLSNKVLGLMESFGTELQP